MPELIPIDDDPFAGYNFRGVTGAPGTQEIAPTSQATTATQIGPQTAPNAPPVTLTPVDYQPILAGEPPIPIPTATGIVNNFADSLKAFLSPPGNVMQPQEPQQPGTWSDVDEATRQANIRGEALWGPQTALMMVGGGGPIAEDAALGAAGARITQGAALPMDEASRMARAADQGFTTDAFHGTGSPEFDAFDPANVRDNVQYGGNFYFTPDAEFADKHTGKWSGDSPRIMPVKLNVQNPFRLDQPITAEDAASILTAAGRHEQAAAMLAGGPLKHWTGSTLFYHALGQDTPVALKAQAIRDAGYDAIIGDPQQEIVGRPGRPHIMVYEPSQIRSRFAAFDPANKGNGFLLGSGATTENNAPRFFSALEAAVGNATTKAAPAEQWLGAIRNTPGVKPEELQWTGLEDWLKAQKGPVSKDAVADYIRGNKVDVQEVEHGGMNIDPEHDLYFAPQDDGTFAGFLKGRDQPLFTGAKTEAEADERLSQYERQAKPTRHGQWVVPGGQNYRELLLTMPPKPDVRSPIEQWPAVKSNANPANFTSSHWDEPNVLAHIRFDDRKIGNDNSLHMAEIQSDWHQKGRREGYQTPPAQPKRTTQEIDADIDANRTALLHREHGIDASSAQDWGEAWARNPDLSQREADLFRERDDALHIGRGVRGVPDAPFKTTWPELSLKRMIRYAAENGYDRLSWDTGATNADRYDLSKQISKVEFTRHGSSGFSRAEDIDDPEGGGILKAYDLNNRKVMDQYVQSPKELADHIGKEATDKLLGQTGRYGVVGGTAQVGRKLEGLDLKVGGEGMAGFYDRMLPAAANKLGKKYGAQVERTELDNPNKDGKLVPRAIGGYYIQFRNGASGVYGSRTEADAALAEYNRGKPAWSLKITPALRKAALEQGFPLFAIGGIATGAVAQHHLQPVDYDPFPTDRRLVPVDHHPFQ